jgi:hypothetical protein
VRLKIAIREAVAKQAIMIATLSVVGAMFMVGDDDDEEEILKTFDIVKGTGGKYIYKNIMPTATKLRTIGGVTTDLYGSIGGALLFMKDFKDNIDKNPDGDYVSILKAAVDAFSSAVLANSIMSGLSQLSDALGDITSSSFSNYFQKKLASLLVTGTLPATGLAKQIGDLASPIKKENISFWDYLANEGGGYTTWTIDKPKLDWRGREYTAGDLYASNVRAITGRVGATKDVLKADEIDIWAEKKGVKTITPKTSFGDAQKDRDDFTLITGKGPRNMDANENYKFRKKASLIFNRKITKLWDDTTTRSLLENPDLSNKEAQKFINRIWIDSKIEAIYELNKEIDEYAVSGYPNIEMFSKRFKSLEKEDSNVYDRLKLKINKRL